jgi:hypothetical protein
MAWKTTSQDQIDYCRFAVCRHRFYCRRLSIHSPPTTGFFFLGNHTTFENNKIELRKLFKNANYIQDETVSIIFRESDVECRYESDVARIDDEIARLTVHGSPWTHERSFVYRANAFTASLKKRRQLLSLAPSDVDILMTHAPPYDILDQVSHNKHEGCLALREALESGQLRPKLHVFGHCHGHGSRAVQFDCDDRASPLFVNAAQECTRRPVVLTLRIAKQRRLAESTLTKKSSSQSSSTTSAKRRRRNKENL